MRQKDLVSILERLAQSLEGRKSLDQVHYEFDPQEDMTLPEVIALLKILHIRTSTDDYLHESFPKNLRRHFRALA